MEPERPDRDDFHTAHLKQMARGADYFADLGRWPRLAGAVFLTPFAAYFLLAGLVTPFPAVHFAWKGERDFAWLMLGIGAGHAAVGAVLAWLALRLWKGERAANGRTVLPTWLVGAFLFGALTPLMLGTSVALVLQALGAAEKGDVRFAVMWAAGAVGMVAGVMRAWVTFARMVRGTDAKAPAPG